MRTFSSGYHLGNIRRPDAGVVRTVVMIAAGLLGMVGVLAVVIAATGSAVEDRPLRPITVHAPQEPAPEPIRSVPATPEPSAAPAMPAAPAPQPPPRPSDASTIAPPPPPPATADVPAPPPPIGPGDDDGDDDDDDDDDG